jgi:hypothetical protein
MARSLLRSTSVLAYLRDERGTISVEAAFMLPLMAFAYVVGFSYFDTYRREAVLTRATDTVAGILSRETQPVGPHDFEGLQDIFEFITGSAGETRLRFTQISRDADGLVIENTYGTDGTQPMTPALLEGIAGKIPRLREGDVIILTESFTTHTPIFRVGLMAREFPRIVPTPMRSGVRLDWDDDLLPDPPVDQPFDPSLYFEPTIPGFDVVALQLAAESSVEDPLDGLIVDTQDLNSGGEAPETDEEDETPTGGDDGVDDGVEADDEDDGEEGDDDKLKGHEKNGDNGHGNETTDPKDARNDDSNPGASNDPDDHTDDDGTTPGSRDTSDDDVTETETEEPEGEKTRGNSANAPGRNK